MARFGIFKISALAARRFIILALIASPSYGQPQKQLDAKIDLVFIIGTSADPDQMELFKDALAKLVRMISIGSDQVRVAIVQPVNEVGKGATIVLPWTKEQGKFEEWLLNFTAQVIDIASGSHKYHHAEAFKLLREQLFDFTDESRAKIVVMLLPEYNSQESNEEAKLLLEKGALIYPMYLSSLKENVSEITSNWMRGVSFDNVDALFTLWPLKLPVENIVRDLCTVCRFNADQSCGPAKRPPSSKRDYFGDNNARCQNVTPSEIPCQKTECEAECDREWPLKKECSESCGPIDREGPAPAGMEHCSKSRPCPRSCPSKTSPSTASSSEVALNTPKSMPREEKWDPWWLWSVLVPVLAVVCLILVAVISIMVMRKRKRARERIEIEIEKKSHRLNTSKEKKVTINPIPEYPRPGEKSESTELSSMSLKMTETKKGQKSSSKKMSKVSQPKKTSKISTKGKKKTSEKKPEPKDDTETAFANISKQMTSPMPPVEDEGEQIKEEEMMKSKSKSMSLPKKLIKK